MARSNAKSFSFVSLFGHPIRTMQNVTAKAQAKLLQRYPIFGEIYDSYRPYFGRDGQKLYRSLAVAGIFFGNFLLAFTLTLINTSFSALVGVLSQDQPTYTAFFGEVGYFIGVILLHSTIASVDEWLTNWLGESLSYKLTKKTIKRWTMTQAYFGTKLMTDEVCADIRAQVVQEIIQAQAINFEPEIDRAQFIKTIVDKTTGFSRQDLLSLITAATLTAQENKKAISTASFNKALEDIIAFSLYKKAPPDPAKLISSDLRLSTFNIVNLCNQFLMSASSFVVGVFGLYAFSGPLVLPLFGITVTIPAYMPIFMGLYALGYQYITNTVGRSLKKKQNDLKDAEAVFNKKLANINVFWEPIALKKGASFEYQSLVDTLKKNRTIYLSIAKTLSALAFFQNIHRNLAQLLGLVLAAPKIIAKEMDISHVFRLSSYVSDVIFLVTWKNDNLEKIEETRVCHERKKSFDEIEDGWQKLQDNIGVSLKITHEDKEAIDINIAVDKPDGEHLIPSFKAHIRKATSGRPSRTLLEGPSGSGKSTIIRALSGIAPHTSGAISGLPAKNKVVFVPSQPYFPEGKTLLEAILYPQENIPELLAKNDPDTLKKVERIKAMMIELNLGDKICELNNVKDWQTQGLSDGQRQRLMIIAGVMADPEYLIMDEATSRVDHLEETQTKDKIEELLKREAALATILFTDHNPSGTFATEKPIRLTAKA